MAQNTTQLIAWPPWESTGLEQELKELNLEKAAFAKERAAASDRAPAAPAATGPQAKKGAHGDGEKPNTGTPRELLKRPAAAGSSADWRDRKGPPALCKRSKREPKADKEEEAPKDANEDEAEGKKEEEEKEEQEERPEEKEEEDANHVDGSKPKRHRTERQDAMFEFFSGHR